MNGRTLFKDFSNICQGKRCKMAKELKNTRESKLTQVGGVTSHNNRLNGGLWGRLLLPAQLFGPPSCHDFCAGKSDPSAWIHRNEFAPPQLRESNVKAWR